METKTLIIYFVSTYNNVYIQGFVGKIDKVDSFEVK